MEIQPSFSEAEIAELINQLIKVTYRADQTDTYVMGYFIKEIAESMTQTFSREISREAVVVEILKLGGVKHDEEDNSLFVLDDYFKQNSETPEMRNCQKNDEPLYPELGQIFIEGGADRADFECLLRSFQTSEGLWLPETGELPDKKREIGAGASRLRGDD